jgi:high-affinity Fe2+/Pb2+ permease
MKRLLLSGVHLVVTGLLAVTGMLYGCISGVMLTRVINDFRLDTYLGVETGLSIILLLVMVVYIPIWFMISLANKG